MNFFNLIFALLFVKLVVSKYDLDPISGKLVLVEHGSYGIGIDDYGELNLEECSFISDTGCNVTFSIGYGSISNKNWCDKETDIFTNVVADRGEEDLCKINVTNVDANGPKTWNLIAYDENTNTKINETFYITFIHLAQMFRGEIRLTESESLFNFLRMEGKKLISCKLNYNDTEIDLDLKTEKSTIKYISSNKQLRDNPALRIRSLGWNLCGFILSNVSRVLDNAVHYKLTTVDDQGLTYTGSFVVRVNARPPPSNLYTPRSIILGDELIISCGWSITEPFCFIFNPDGQLVSENCTYTYKVATADHLGKWKCFAGDRESMVGLEYTIELFKRDRPIEVETWQNETTDYLNIGFRLNSVPSFIYCKMIAPNGHIINVLNFVASERFSSIGTNLNDRICSIKIKKPLMNSEIGLWKFEYLSQYKTAAGAFLHVNSMAVPEYHRELQLTAEMGKSLSVTCQVPYSSEYCRIKAPNGAIHIITELSDLSMGKCQFDIDVINTWDNGTWTCIYGRSNGLPDEEIKVEVSIAQLLRYSKRVEADSADRITLSCSSGGIPLQYCRFISPNGIGYHLGNHQNSGRIGYYGKGIEYGECGISILNILPSEAGEWTCITKFFNESNINIEKEQIGKIFVDVISPPPGINVGAIGIGTGVAIVLVGFIISIVVIRKWKQKRNAENNTIAETNPLNLNN